MAGEALPYIFGGNTDIQNYEELKRRRAVAAAIAARQRPFPKTLGEGLTALGESVGDVWADKRLAEMERGQTAYDRANSKPSPGSYAPGAGAAPGGAALPPGVGPDGPVPPVADNAARDSLAATLTGPAPQEVAQANPTSGAETPRGGRTPDDAAWSARKYAIGGIESDHNYRAVGVPTKYGRALGLYGVIEANVPQWTKEALGQALTPQQFLANDEAQDAVFKHRFGQYVAKYGEEGAARAWYGGPGNVNNPNAMDQHERLTVRDYGQDYLKRLQGRRAEADDSSSPVQLAALGGPAGTMTDAPPPGAGARPMPGVEVEPDPTVTEDIKPMSVRTQIAQAPAGLIPGSVAGVPGVPAAGVLGPPAGAPGAPTVAAPGMPPSRAPIPPASDQEMPDPGPEPPPPPRLGVSAPARDFARMAADPRLSDERRAWAAEQFKLEEGYRKELQTRQDSIWVNQRERWEKLRDAKDKFDREREDRRIDQLVKRVGVENAQIAAEKGYYEQGIPREQAQAQAAAAIREAQLRIRKAEYEETQRPLEERGKLATTQKTEQEVAAPETREIGGVVYQRQKATPGTPAGPWEVAPGSPKKEEKLTEVQGKTIKFLQRATVASSQLGDASVLAGLKDTAAGKVPIGGNYLTSPEYQRARSAAFTWGQAVLRDESGAVLGAGEIANKLSAYFPEPGDSEQVIRDKAFRRKAEEESLYHSLGEAKPTIDKWREERKTRRVTIDPATGQPYPEGAVRINNKTGEKQRVMGGHWENEEDLR